MGRGIILGVIVGLGRLWCGGLIVEVCVLLETQGFGADQLELELFDLGCLT